MKDSNPLLFSSALSVLAAVSAVWVVATAPVQRSALTVHVVALVALFLAVRAARRDHWLLGAILGAAAVAGVALAFRRGQIGTVAHRFELYPGLVGPVLLVLGLAPVRRGWERLFVTLGTGLVLASIVTGGVVRSADTVALLAAGVLTVAAWDLGEQAINLSEQVGDRARTWPVEVTHGGVAALVGGVAVGAALFVTSVGVSGVPLAGLSVLLGATVVLTTALYN